MRAPLSWLRDYAPLDAPIQRLSDALSNLGLVVEGVELVGEGLDDIVVARVLDIRTHPRADRIRLVDVDPGDGGPLQIVCGAWNFAVGDLVPLAPVGSVLPGDLRISARKMRGEVSNGMLCSASELGLPDAPGGADGLLILPGGLAEPGAPLRAALGIEPDVVFDIDISPNRPDALSMAGVSRDLAAALGEEWGWPPEQSPEPADEIGTAVLEIDSADLCPRFTATVLEGVPGGSSPAWMARRLVMAGMRPISAVVDASNYVMLDVGQPNHAYDLGRLGGGGLRVRRGRAGEKLVTLDGIERELAPEDCVICDAADVPVGVAGIMGGASAEITEGTTRVLLEAAWFDPGAIARTGKRLGLHSEARVRFERGVDPEAATRAVDRFVSLVATFPGGQGVRRGPTVDFRSDSLPGSRRVRLRTSRTNAVLGTGLTPDDVASLLGPLGFGVTAAGQDEFDVDVPTWRLECEREIDLIEEVARMWGYRRVSRTLPAGARSRTGGLSARQKERRRIRSVLAGAGLDEAWTTTFLAPGDLTRAGLHPDAVEVENPLDSSESLLRTSLLPGLLKALRSNLDRQADGLALFEIGRVFERPDDGGTVPAESEWLGAALLPEDTGSERLAVDSAVRLWMLLASALRLDGCTVDRSPVPGLHAGRSAVLRRPDGSVLGSVGEVAPEVANAYGIDGRVGWLETSLDALEATPRRPLLAREPSRYPASDLDLALVTPDEVPASVIGDALRRAGGDLVEDLTLFDVYRHSRLGEDRRSLAFRVRFRAGDRTLGDEELATLRDRLIAAASAAGASLRGS